METTTKLPSEVQDCLDAIDFGQINLDLESGELSHNDDGSRVRSIYLGSILHLTPSGKVYTPFACGNVDPCESCRGAGCDTCGHTGCAEAWHDELFWEEVDRRLDAIDSWREGSEGDGCDVLVCRHDESADLILDDEQLDGARQYDKYDLPTYDDGWGPIWIVQEPCGNFARVARVIRAETFESAYEIHEDESTPVPMDQIHEAYGTFDRLVEKYPKLGSDTRRGGGLEFLSRFAPEYFAACTRNANQTGAWDNWDLIEGYSYQSNATDSGIVEIDPSTTIDQATPELLEALEIKLAISAG